MNYTGGDYPQPGSMIDGYDFNSPITFNQYGHFASGQLPEDCISGCCASGSVDEAVEYWVKKLEFSVPRQLAETYLKEYGAWDDLQTADDEMLNQRILWTACCDIAETGEWFGVCH